MTIWLLPVASLDLYHRRETVHIGQCSLLRVFLHVSELGEYGSIYPCTTCTIREKEFLSCHALPKASRAHKARARLPCFSDSDTLFRPTGCATRRCAAEAAERECIGRYQDGWNVLCLPDGSLPMGLHSERKGGVEHIGGKGHGGERHHCSGWSMQRVSGETGSG